MIAAGCDGTNLSAACDAVRNDWRQAEDYRRQITFIKVNSLEHYEFEMQLAGHICLPPEFYDLEEVIQGCTDDKKLTAVTIDRCVNFYDENYTGEASCEDFVAICNNYTEALSAGNDSVGTIAQGLTVSDEERDEIIAGVIELWGIILDCDATDQDFLDNSIVQVWPPSARMIIMPHKGLYSVCLTEPIILRPDCKPNGPYRQRIATVDDLYILTTTGYNSQMRAKVS